MYKSIDSLVNAGKKVVTGLAMLTLVSCASVGPTRADRNYHFHPQGSQQLAKSNIERILNDVCDQSFVNNEGLYCKDKRCLGGKYVTTYSKTLSGSVSSQNSFH